MRTSHLLHHRGPNLTSHETTHSTKYSDADNRLRSHRRRDRRSRASDPTPQGSPDIPVAMRHDCSRRQPPEPRTTQRAAELFIRTIHTSSVAAAPGFRHLLDRLGALPSGLPRRVTIGLSTVSLPDFAALDLSADRFRSLPRAPSLQYVHSTRALTCCQEVLPATFKELRVTIPAPRSVPTISPPAPHRHPLSRTRSSSFRSPRAFPTPRHTQRRW